MKRSLILFVLLWNLLLLPVAALADSGEPAPAAATSVAPATPDAAEPELHFPGVSGLTAFHTYFSHNVENLSRRVDSFFATTRAYEESSGTYLLVRGSVIYGRGGAIDYDGKLRAHLDLPNLSDRINLLIESEQPDQPNEDALTTGNSTFPQNINNQALAASLQYILQAKEFWDVRLQPGIKLKWMPDPFVRLRFRWLNPLSVTWLSRVTFTPAWYSSQRVERPAPATTWSGERAGRGCSAAAPKRSGKLNDPHNLFWTEVLFFAHPFGSRAQVAYDLGVNGEIEPKFEDTRYFSSIRYRRDIHHGWVFLELKPQIEFLRDDDFKPDPSIALTLEMLFGGRYL